LLNKILLLWLLVFLQSFIEMCSILLYNYLNTNIVGRARKISFWYNDETSLGAARSKLYPPTIRDEDVYNAADCMKDPSKRTNKRMKKSVAVLFARLIRAKFYNAENLDDRNSFMLFINARRTRENSKNLNDIFPYYSYVRSLSLFQSIHETD